MTIVQWQGVSNISIQFYSITPKKRRTFKNIFFLSACNLEAQLPCLESAEDILSQYDFTEENLDVDFYALTILYLAFNLFAFIILWLRVRKY